VPCSPLKINRRFGGTCLHHESQRISHTRNYQSLSSASSWFLTWFILRPWRWRRHVPQKRGLIVNGLHGVISQKMCLHNHCCKNLKSWRFWWNAHIFVLRWNLSERSRPWYWFKSRQT
jgi:hypothetical protein